MPEEMGGTAVLETADTSVNTDISSTESNSSTDTTNTDDVSRETQPDKQDGRRQPDALKKHIADLRRRADSITDPIEKKAELDRIKFLYDTSGKARGYEEVYPTVREAREVKALIESMGGRDGLTKMQSVYANAEQIDAKLAAGDPSIAKDMWDEAPDGMPKLMPVLLDRFEQEKPQEYEKFITPKAVVLLDQVGFTQAFDRMVRAYEGGKLDDAKAIRDELIKWVTGNRQQQTQEKTNPEVERLQRELNERNQKDEEAKVDKAYGEAITYAGPAIDKVAKPMLAKFGLTGEEYSAFRAQVWSHLQDTRNSNETYKTVAPAKVRQGYDKWTEYANRWTDENAEHSIRAVLKMPPWTRLQPSTKTTTAATQSPVKPNIQTGKEPTPAEIDYSFKGKQAAQKAGFKSLEDMILSGQAPLKAGGIRKWR